MHNLDNRSPADSPPYCYKVSQLRIVTGYQNSILLQGIKTSYCYRVSRLHIVTKYGNSVFSQDITMPYSIRSHDKTTRYQIEANTTDQLAYRKLILHSTPFSTQSYRQTRGGNSSTDQVEFRILTNNDFFLKRTQNDKF